MVLVQYVGLRLEVLLALSTESLQLDRRLSEFSSTEHCPESGWRAAATLVCSRPLRKSVPMAGSGVAKDDPVEVAHTAGVCRWRREISEATVCCESSWLLSSVGEVFL